MVAMAEPIEMPGELAARLTPDLLMESLYPGFWDRPPHVRYMGAKLASVVDGGRRIIVQVSVRHGKSYLGAHGLPVWYLSCFPDHSVAIATYQANLAARWGRRVRNTIMRCGSRLDGLVIADDSAAAHSWETTVGGGVHTAGVGGEFTGRGFDLMVIDDPIKNAEEANSELIRDNVWDWWTTTAYTRLEPNASVVLIMARWHEDDLAGRLIADMKAGGEPWEVISLPALAEDNDALGRKPGEPLWPQRYDRKALDRIKRAVGSSAWSALYQQRPTPGEGGMFKRDWFRYYVASDEGGERVYTQHVRQGVTRRVMQRDCWRFMSCDLALTTKTYNDYSVWQVWDVEKIAEVDDDGKTVYRGGDMFLVEQWRERMEAPYVEDSLRSALTRYKPLFIGVEDNSNFDTSVIQRFKRDGLPVRPIKPDRDKITRATTASVWMENGHIWFPQVAPWLDTLEGELLSFPNGAHDDAVDTLAYAAIFANNRNLWTKPEPPPLPKGSMGDIGGMGKILGPKPRSAAFAMDQRR